MDARFIARCIVHAIGVVLALGIAARTPAAAATLPAGFTESQVASGLASPTAMQFAPDGRLFVCQQGGRLRVIKNGALLPTPFVTLTVNSLGRARPARRRLRSGLRNESLCLRLLHGDHADRSQSHQPLHRQRRRRRPAARSSSSISTTSAAPPTTTAARSPSARTGSSTRPSARTPTARTRRRWRTCSAKCSASTRRHDPHRQSVLHHGDRPQSRDLGARAAQPVHVRVQPEPAGDVHQRRRAEHVGGDQRRSSPARTTAGPRPRAPTERPALRRAALRLQRTVERRLRDHRRRLLLAAERPVPGRLRRRLFLRRLLRRLDLPGSIPMPATPSRNFASGIASPVDLKVSDDGAPVLSRARHRARRPASCYRIDYGAGAPAITTAPCEPDRRGRGTGRRSA